MKYINFQATISKGKMALIQKERFLDAVKSQPDGTYFGILEKKYKVRSLQQNKARFGIAYKILRQCMQESFGESVSIDFVHEYCKTNLLPSAYVEKLKEGHKNCYVDEKTGLVIDIPFRLTTTKLSTIEEMEYYQNIQRFAIETFNCEIPNINE